MSIMQRIRVFNLLCILCIIGQQIGSEPLYTIYHSDRVRIDNMFYDCLLFDERFLSREDVSLYQYQITPFCIRPFIPSSNTLIDNPIEVIHGTSITFENLQNQNYTSEDLYLSSVPIDIIERYQEYLENSNQSLSTEKIYNCTSPWFGEFCQYTFDSTLSFNTVVRNYFRYEIKMTEFSFNMTCFTFLKCNRGPPPFCLDWRDICDGKIDCSDSGIDEAGCEELELVDCRNDEFRCNNGFCIPHDFFDDDPLNPDCIDRSDEKDTNQGSSYLIDCMKDPAFRCEETACRNEHEYTCGPIACRIFDCHHNNLLLERALFSWHENSNLTFNCWISLTCLTVNSGFANLFDDIECPMKDISIKLFQENCPSIFFFPAQPIFLGHIRFVYGTNFINDTIFDYFLLPDYICYNQQLCEFLPATILINGSSCRLLSEINLKDDFVYWVLFERTIIDFFRKCSSKNNSYLECPKAKPYRCANSSKCLALNRLMDSYEDCFQGDDEQIRNSCSLPDKQYRFRCLTEDTCISISKALDGRAGCPRFRNDINPLEEAVSNQMLCPLSFPLLCNGFVQYTMIDGVNSTDEMDCEYWPCDNIYTRCDDRGTWHCLNGADEMDCPRNPCRPSGHPCILLNNYTLTCLPLHRFNDGIIDCLGAYDERSYCRQLHFPMGEFTYRCINTNLCVWPGSVCHSSASCSLDEVMIYSCKDFPGESTSWQWWCHDYLNSLSTPQTLNQYSYLCSFEADPNKRDIEYFTLRNHLNYPVTDLTTKEDMVTHMTAMEMVRLNRPTFHSMQQVNNHTTARFCHRGIRIYTYDLEKTYCLCPPAYFGNQCQYQSQRVSLTLQFRTAQWKTLFTFVIMLMDNHTNIHSYEHIDYLPVRDCRKKFNIYLLYSTRPKLLNYTYSIRIDAYNKIKKEHYTSLYYPIHFPFLPVHRLAFQVDIPLEEALFVPKNCSLKCLHGQCTQFLNVETFFCRCIDGYSGTLCTEKNDCNCSPDSICIGTSHHRSICVCPQHKFGSRCYLNITACRSHSCSNDSQCIASDVKLFELDYFCLCPEGLIGSKCENKEMKIEFHFDSSISIPQSMIIHFIFVPSRPLTSDLIEDIEYAESTQTSQIVKIRYSHNSAMIYYGDSFHLIFLQINQQYYLALLQHNYTKVTNLSTTIIPQHHCQSTDELFDKQILSLPRWHRAKYYHLPCQNHSNLTCFYDNDYFMCLCDIDRHANCFRFDFHRIYNCFGYNYCQNDGQCYQDNNTCPTSSSCFCKECYFGSQCQFTSIGFGLSLDDILGYSIWPNISFSQQPSIIKISTSITIVMFVLSIINSILCIITLRTKKSLAVGCGLYLLVASITSLLTMTMFTLKCLLLVFSQMSVITNKSFLLINCILMDMTVKSFLAIGDWLNACVAIERVMTVYVGVTFNKKKSKLYAKWVTVGICLFTFASYIPDPVHRQLLEDNEEQRTWCVVRYSSSIRSLIIFINIIHFIVPLGINMLSVLIIIVLVARQKSTTNSQETYREHLSKQYHQHKHRLFSSIVLILIAIPRLIISFLTKCMASARNPGLYVAGYFISFIPPLLEFILFVLPSEFYRKEFRDATVAIRTTMQRRFRRREV